MPTSDDLNREKAWRAEVAAPGLVRLADGLHAHFGATAEIGLRGDSNHLRGYHRSRRWIRESIYCTNRSYSVTETTGNQVGGDDNWTCAIDIGLPSALLLPMCRRLDVAIRSGRLEKITEWYGNLGGDNRVDGYNNILNRLASSDSSHLFHAHLSFDRGRANDDHSDVLAVLIGDDDVTPDDIKKVRTSIWYEDLDLGQRSISAGTALLNALDNGEKTAAAVEALRGAITTPPPVVLDYAKLAEALRPIIREEIDKTKFGS